MTRPLLTPDDFTRIVAEGRAAEALALYVKRPPGRPASEDATTAAERQRAYRARQTSERRKGSRGKGR
jgi:hypothetical protein